MQKYIDDITIFFPAFNFAFNIVFLFWGLKLAVVFFKRHRINYLYLLSIDIGVNFNYLEISYVIINTQKYKKIKLAKLLFNYLEYFSIMYSFRP